MTDGLDAVMSGTLGRLQQARRDMMEGGRGDTLPIGPMEGVLARLKVLERAVMSMLQGPVVQVMKLDPEAKMPRFAYPGDAGADLFALETVDLPPHRLTAVRTGIAVAVPEGFELQVRSRSGLARKNAVMVLNSPGTIDSGYRGEILVLLFNHSDSVHTVFKGTAVAQGIVSKLAGPVFAEVHELPPSERGEKGFGSSTEGAKP